MADFIVCSRREIAAIPETAASLQIQLLSRTQVLFYQLLDSDGCWIVPDCVSELPGEARRPGGPFPGTGGRLWPLPGADLPGQPSLAIFWFRIMCIVPSAEQARNKPGRRTAPGEVCDLLQQSQGPGGRPEASGGSDPLYYGPGAPQGAQ